MVGELELSGIYSELSEFAELVWQVGELGHELIYKKKKNNMTGTWRIIPLSQWYMEGHNPRISGT